MNHHFETKPQMAGTYYLVIRVKFTTAEVEMWRPLSVTTNVGHGNLL
jgi:hypothetical protein